MLSNNCALENTQFENIVRSYNYLVHKISASIHSRLPHSVQVDDLYQAGMIGLLLAARQHDPKQGDFLHYATIRIRGAIFDELRKSDWVPSYIRKKFKSLVEVIRKLENQLGKQPQEHEVAQEMNLSLTEYHQLLADLNIGQPPISLDEMLENNTPEGFTSVAANTESFNEATLVQLMGVLKNLPLRESLILTLYYHEEMNLKDIAHLLQMTESRISQLQSQAIRRVRENMTN